MLKSQSKKICKNSQCLLIVQLERNSSQLSVTSRCLQAPKNGLTSKLNLASTSNLQFLEHLKTMKTMMLMVLRVNTLIKKADQVEVVHPSEQPPLSLYLLEPLEIRATLSSKTQTKAVLPSLPSSPQCSRWPRNLTTTIQRWMASPIKVGFSAQKLPIYTVGLVSTLRT